MVSLRKDATDGGAVVLVVAVTWKDIGAVEEQAPRGVGRAGSRGPVVAVGTSAAEAIVPAAGEDAGPSTRKLPVSVLARCSRTSS